MRQEKCKKKKFIAEYSIATFLKHQINVHWMEKNVLFWISYEIVYIYSFFLNWTSWRDKNNIVSIGKLNVQHPMPLKWIIRGSITVWRRTSILIAWVLSMYESWQFLVFFPSPSFHPELPFSRFVRPLCFPSVVYTEEIIRFYIRLNTLTFSVDFMSFAVKQEK